MTSAPTAHETAMLGVYDQLKIATEAMLAATSASEWDALLELQARRAELLAELERLDRGEPVSTEFLEAKRQRLTELVALDRTLATHCEVLRIEARDGLASLPSYRRAVRAYEP